MIVSTVWHELLLGAGIFGLGFAAGAALFSGVLSLFKKKST